jgi:hypothetical protein
VSAILHIRINRLVTRYAEVTGINMNLSSTNEDECMCIYGRNVQCLASSLSAKLRRTLGDALLLHVPLLSIKALANPTVQITKLQVTPSPA